MCIKSPRDMRSPHSVCRKFIVTLVSTTALAAGVDTAWAQDGSEDSLETIESITVFGRGREDSLREVPQTAQVFDTGFLDDVAAVDITDIVRFLPSASTQYSQIGWLADAYFVRGFGITQVINGARLNTANFPLDSQFMERIEVLMGPASVLYGSMQPGAVINVVTKTPREEFHLEAAAELGSFDHQRFTLDVGGPITDSVSVRLNAVYQDRESFLDFWEEEKLTIAPAIEWALSSDTTLNILGIYAKTDQPAGGYLGGPAAGLLTENPNGDYPRSFYVQSPDEEGVGRTRETANIEVTLRHRFTDSLSARAVFSYTHVERDDQSIIGLLQDDFRTLNRLQIGNVSDGDDYSGYVDLAGEFVTGPITHQVSVGGEYFTTKFNNLQTRFIVNPIDLYAPVYGAVLELDNRIRFLPSEIDDKTVGVFIQDRMSVGDRVHLIAGLRYAKITSENTGNKVSQSDVPTMFGIVADVTDAISVFGNRSESFIPRSGTTADNTVFAPESSVQYEGGVKFGMGGLSGTVSLFRVKKPDVLTPDLDNPGFQVPLGSVTTKGFEASVSGEPLPGLTVYAAYAYMTSNVVSNDPSLDGTDLRYAPENTFSFTGRYDIGSGPFEGVGLTAALQFTDDRFLGAGNALEVPSFVRIDLGINYSVTDHVELGILANNVTNADIFSGFGSTNNVDINPPRTFLARVRLGL